MSRSQNYQKYAGFSAEDFLQDDFFIQSAGNRSGDGEDFWSAFLKHYPEAAGEFRKAQSFLDTFKFKEYKPSSDQKRKMWKFIESGMSEEKKGGVIKFLQTHSFRWAAAAVLLIMLGSYFFVYLNGNQHYHLKSGEFKTINLSDGSKVTLSPNSELTFKRNFKNQEIREVWLTGEAYFSVAKSMTKTLERKPFIVYTKDLRI